MLTDNIPSARIVLLGMRTCSSVYMQMTGKLGDATTKYRAQ